MRISDWSSDVCSSDLIIGHINVQSLGTLRSEVEAALKQSRQLECPIRIAWKDQLTECVIQIRTIITAIKNSLGIHRGDDFADLDVIIIRRNRQARSEARLQEIGSESCREGVWRAV